MNDSRRCKAHSSRTGERCKKSAMLGQTTCRKHGGASPQSMKAARERLNDLVDPAISTLRTILRQGVKTGDYAAAVRASIAILDRCGFHPTKAVELFGKDGGPIEVDTTIKVEMLPIWLKQAIVVIGSGGSIDPEIERTLQAYFETRFFECEKLIGRT